MDDLLPIAVFVSRHPHHESEASLRWKIFKRAENGLELAGAVVKKAGRWYVNVPKYREWILSGDEAA